MGSTKRRLTPAMSAMLRNLAEGRAETHGLSGRSAFGGATRTHAALVSRGYIDRDGLTESGRAVLELETQHPGRE